MRVAVEEFVGAILQTFAGIAGGDVDARGHVPVGIALDTNTGLFSPRMYRGTRWRVIGRDCTSMTRRLGIEPATSMARDSRVYLSLQNR